MAARWRRTDRVLVAVVLLAAFLRFYGLRSSSLWFDELVSTQVVSDGNVFWNVAHLEGSPPLYFLLLWVWKSLFGGGDDALRALSALVGTAIVPVAYAVARELTDRRRVARVAALLVAVNPMLVWFSQEARAYSLVAFLGSLSLLFCVRSVVRGRTADLVGWGLASAAALGTHYFAAFLLLPEAVWLVLALRPQWRKLALGVLPLVVAAPLIYFPFFRIQRAENLQRWVGDTTLGFRYAEAGRQAVMGPGGWDDRIWVATAVLVAVAALLVVVRGDRSERRAAAVLALIGGAGLLLPLLGVPTGNDFFLGRNAIAVLVPLAVVVAVGLGARRAGWVGIAATVGLAGLSTAVVLAVATHDDLQKADWRRLGATLGTATTDRIVVIQHDGHLAMPLVRYLPGARVLDSSETVRVPEIDLVYHFPEENGRCGYYQGRDCDPATFLFPLFPERLADKYLYVGKPHFETFAFNRYQSDRPPPVRVSDFAETPKKPNLVVLFVEGDRGG